MRPGPMIYGADSAQVADMHGDLLARDETAANVRLVVEAPAMLAALRHAVDTEEGNWRHDEEPQWITDARELLARIDGAAR